jgi:hypothetical protein
MTGREIAIGAPLVALAILFGVYPRAILDYTKPSVSKTVDNLKTWMENVELPEQQAAALRAEADQANANNNAVEVK